MVDNGKYHKSLTNFLKFFINRPNHLARYLLENDAIDQKFLNTLETNKSLSEDLSAKINVHFIDINQMNTFFKSLISNKNSKKKDFEDLKTELEKELNVCIKEERYEDAIRIRDYLKKISKDPF
jgi:excinuclease UvrABC helicase subunit UvrB